MRTHNSLDFEQELKEFLCQAKAFKNPKDVCLMPVGLLQRLVNNYLNLLKKQEKYFCHDKQKGVTPLNRES